MRPWRGLGEQALPEAAIVFDKFRIKKHLNEAVDKIRRQEHRQLSAAGIPTLAGTKYLWLRGHEDLRQRAAAQFRSLLVPGPADRHRGR